MSGAGQPPRRPPRSGQPGRGAPRRGAPAPGDARSAQPARTGRGARGSVDQARSAALDLLREVADDDAYANLAMPGILAARRVHGRDAALATEIAYGVLRLRARYDAIIAAVLDRGIHQVDPVVLDLLRMGTHQLLAMRVPDHAAVSSTVGVAHDRVGPAASGFVNAVLRRVAARDLDGWLTELVPLPEDPATASDAVLAVRESHPEWVVRALRQSLRLHGRPSAEILDLLTADNTIAGVTLLARPGFADSEALRRSGATPGRWSPHAWDLHEGAPGSVPGVSTGAVRVADEGSQLVALALTRAPLTGAARAQERWLDLCAGPGGKSALLSALARNRATGVSVEVRAHRADLVRQAVAGAEAWWDVQVTDGRLVGEDEPAAYDRVLADVPCTGLGALRRRPESRWRRTPSDLAELSPLQRELATSALLACRPGGLVAYVTCSPHPAETLAVLDDLEKSAARGRVPAFELVDARPFVVDRDGNPLPDLGEGPSVQLWPHRHGTDAMFLAVLRRA